jgi:chromosome segregation ATPase
MGFDYFTAAEVHRLLGDLLEEMRTIGAACRDHNACQRDTNKRVGVRLDAVVEELEKLRDKQNRLEKQETVNSGAITTLRHSLDNLDRRLNKLDMGNQKKLNDLQLENNLQTRERIDTLAARLDKMESDRKLGQVVVDWQREARAEREAELAADLQRARYLLQQAPTRFDLFPDQQETYARWLRKVNAFLDRLCAEEKGRE